MLRDLHRGQLRPLFAGRLVAGEVLDQTGEFFPARVGVGEHRGGVVRGLYPEVVDQSNSAAATASA